MANPFSQNQLTFASHLIGGTGLNGGVVMAWMAMEEPVGNKENTDPSGHGAQNWLNIGITGSGNYGYANSVWTDPAAAGVATADWLKGHTIGSGGYTSTGYPNAASSIQHILDHVTESPQAQISALENSGWAGSGYPGLASAYAQYKNDAPAGTNTAQQTAPHDASTAGVFQIGDTTNPGEDYWSGINRLAQEVNWYVFTRTDAPDGVLFIADGTWLMTNQKPILTLDRWANQAQILSVSFTWDNTAFEYARSKAHKKGKSRQTRTSRVAKVASPTECQLELVCNVDAFHPGDIFWLTSCGPGSGPWLVAEKRRSIFDVFSEFTLTPAIAPITISGRHDTTENIDTSTQGSAGGGASSGLSGSGSPGAPGSSGTLAAVIYWAKVLSDMQIRYPSPDQHFPGSNAQAHPPDLDCSSSTSWVLHHAGMFPSNDPWVSGQFASSWGQPGRGQHLTIWANSGHVFFEVNDPSVGHMQGNTSGPQGGGAGFRWFPWGSNGEADANSGSFAARHWPGT